MKASEYKEKIQKLIDEHGDLEVEKHWHATQFEGRVMARSPIVLYRKILKGRQSKDTFWCFGVDDDDTKGQAVIVLD
jgi:hypothetical protein